MDCVADEAREIIDLIDQWQAEGVNTKKQFDAIATSATSIILQLIEAQAPLGLVKLDNEHEISEQDWIQFLKRYMRSDT